MDATGYLHRRNFMKNTPSPAGLGLGLRRSSAARTAAAATVYIALCIYLYYPYVPDFQPRQYLILLNSLIGALGCFVLSKRWISAYPGSLIAGAVYGFSPFAFGFAAYHPLAGVTLAALPWLFCPAAFWRKSRHHRKLSTQKGRTSLAAIITAALSLIPFAAIILFFQLSAHNRTLSLFPVPLDRNMTFANMIGLAAPLLLEPHDFIFSFYHIPLVALLMGLCMYVTLGRPGIVIVVGIALVLAFSDPVAQVSPVVWGLIPLLFGAVLVGLGAEGLAWAGHSDLKWILFCIVSTVLISAGCFYLSRTSTQAWLEPAVMHAMSVVLAGIILFLAKANLRLHALRWTLMCTAIALDILISARFLLNKLF